jgi:hypothetical protein
MRMPWRAMYQYKKRQREAVEKSILIATLSPQFRKPSVPLTVIMTRFGKRKLDSDNLAGCFKVVRDCIAQWIGVDDGDERYTWICRQEVGKEYGLRIEFNEEK